jgi:two-component system, response regulator
LENPNEIELILIEDNPFDAELTLRALQNRGLADRVKVFPDGVEALEFLFKIADHQRSERNGYPGLPKVIFLDLKLPKMSGLEVLNQIKRDDRTHLIPVVMLTSSQEESDILESYALGVNSYMVKPVDYDDFSRAVGDLGVYWLRRNKIVH